MDNSTSATTLKPFFLQTNLIIDPVLEIFPELDELSCTLILMISIGISNKEVCELMGLSINSFNRKLRTIADIYEIPVSSIRTVVLTRLFLKLLSK